MKTLLLFVMCVLPAYAGAPGDVAEKTWNHGSADCAGNHDPAIEVFEVDSDTYVLRQNKCVDFEAPFIYVLFGKHTVFVQDTGATSDPGRFPLYDTLQRLIVQQHSQGLKILVTHSHGHTDHTAGDSQFRGKPGVTLVEPNPTAVRSFFGFMDWPNGSATIDLGGRTLEVIPVPGHQEEAIAVHDPQTGWLLTGDNLYRGRLYVKDWNEYRSSMSRLEAFSKTRRISAVLGTHIEMSRSGKLFVAGSTYQPDEASLVMAAEDLLQLNQVLQKAGDRPQEIVTAKFVVTPIGVLQRVISNISRWLLVH